MKHGVNPAENRRILLIFLLINGFTRYKDYTSQMFLKCANEIIQPANVIYKMKIKNLPFINSRFFII